jgi:hypothetical protein
MTLVLLVAVVSRQPAGGRHGAMAPPPAPDYSAGFFDVAARSGDSWSMFSWASGARLGTLHPPVTTAGALIVTAPDRSRFVSRGLWGDADTLVDATGATLGTVPPTGGEFLWSDDSRHLCAVLRGGGPFDPVRGTLELAVLDASPTPHHVADLPYTNGPATTFPSLASCSTSSDLAIVVFRADSPEQGNHRGGTVSVPLVEAIRLSDGAVVARAELSGVGEVVAAADGRLIAELHGTNGPVTIRDLLAGRDLATLPAGSRPGTFSGDGTSLIVGPPLSSGAVPPFRLENVAVEDGHVLWSRLVPGNFAIIPQPDGGSFVLAGSDPRVGPATPMPQSGRSAPLDVLLLLPDGHAIQVAHGAAAVH